MHENWDLPLWQGQLRIFRTDLESFKKKLKKKKEIPLGQTIKPLDHKIWGLWQLVNWIQAIELVIHNNIHEIIRTSSI